MSNEVDVQKFKRVIPRRVRIVFKSGHTETLEIPDDVEVTWKIAVGGRITDLNIPQVQGNQGTYLDLNEVAALFVLNKEEI